MTAAAGPGDLDRLDDVVALAQFGRLERDDHQGLGAVQAGRPLGLGRIEDPEVGRPQLGLHDVAHGVVPGGPVANVMPAVARNTGRRCTRIHAEVMMPRMPSLPIIIRSGDGPAPEPGSRRDSHQPCGVSIRTDSTKSSMWVWLVA